MNNQKGLISNWFIHMVAFECIKYKTAYPMTILDLKIHFSKSRFFVKNTTHYRGFAEITPGGGFFFMLGSDFSEPL